MIDEDSIHANRSRALTPDHPVIRGTAQNPDAFFQAREAGNPYYVELPRLVREAMRAFAARTGRVYQPFDYEGHPQAERVIVIMGSGGEAVAETVGWLNANGEKTGVVKVRLYRPFSVEDFAAVLPKSVKSIAVLDRSKEPGALGEPLYLDVAAALRQADSAGWLKDTHQIRLIGGRYGLGSKEFTPAPIRSTYLIRRAEFVACHRFDLLQQINVLDYTQPGGIFLLNSPGDPREVWNRLPREIQEQIIFKSLTFYAIDASTVARDVGMAGRINTIMQTCYFAISGVLEKDEAIASIKKAIQKTYGKRGDAVVQRNYEAVDRTLENLVKIDYPDAASSTIRLNPIVPPNAPDFVQRVTALMLGGKGDLLPVSAFPVDGVWPTGTTQWEKRNIAEEIPVWESDLCVQVCPAKDKSNPSRKAINMSPQLPLRETERKNFAFFLGLPDPDREMLRDDVKSSQFMQPLFEFSGACAGCCETPYLKLLTLLFGDRVLIANATGCSSIYGGNLPTTPYTTNGCGRGPAWANSLFEDNAEFGLGMRASLDQSRAFAQVLLHGQASLLGDDLVTAITLADQTSEAVSYFPRLEDYALGPERYLNQIARIKQSVDIPVISPNSSTPWARRG